MLINSRAGEWPAACTAEVREQLAGAECSDLVAERLAGALQSGCDERGPKRVMSNSVEPRSDTKKNGDSGANKIEDFDGNRLFPTSLL